MADGDAFTLESADATDAVLSTDQTRLYVSRDDGKTDVFDVATHAKLATWNVGAPLGALSVAQDGSYLLAVDSRQPVIYRIDTGTGVVSNTYIGQGSSITDVQVIDGGMAAVTGTNPSLLNLQTGTFSALQNANYYSGYSIMNTDGHLTLLGETGISNGPLFILDNQTGKITASGDDYQSPNTGFNFGWQAISQAAGEVLQGIYPGSINIYDLNLKYERSVRVGDYDNTVVGLAFDKSGSHVYAYLSGGSLVEYDSHSFTELHRFSVGTTAIGSSAQSYGNSLTLTDNGHYAVLTNSSYTYNNSGGVVQLVDISSAGNPINGNIGTDQADVITPAGYGMVDGRGGYDTLVLAGARDSYQIAALQNSVLLTNQNGNSYDVLNIEQVRFSDSTVDLTSLLRDNPALATPQAEIFRLYETALGRLPDPAGFMAWVGELNGGRSLASVAQSFVDSSEFQAKYASLSNSAFVDTFYQQALHRAPDPAGRADYITALDSGSTSRAGVILSMSESDEQKSDTAVAVSAKLFTVAEPDAHAALQLLYHAELGRLPDDLGMFYYEQEIANGKSLKTISNQISQSDEFHYDFSGLSDKQFVDQLYLFALHRFADPMGEAAYVGELQHGYTRGDVAYQIAGSTEHQQLLNVHSDLFV